MVWDIIVVQHEIGHNFNSPHTHDYCNIGGSALPIDNCWAGCQAGATVAAADCCVADAVLHQRRRRGHDHELLPQRSGGYGNIAMTFGEGHTCGTKPEREAARMTAHVAARAASYPACFAAPKCGNGVLDHGEQCDGVNLGGATCSSSGFAGGTLTCSATCTLITSQCTNCGNNVIDAGEICDGTALGGGTCAAEGCTGGTLACNATCSGYDTTGCFGCPPCNANGICDSGEDCTGCPSDCVCGTSTGARCGNGICEAGNGEDCLSCPSDCNGNQGGSRRTVTVAATARARTPCRAPTAAARPAGPARPYRRPRPPSAAATAPANRPRTARCARLDCSGASEICGNGVDDDCNGKIDCTDTTCSSLTSCQCRSSSSSCTSNSQCCSGSCRTSGKNAYTCY